MKLLYTLCLLTQLLVSFTQATPIHNSQDGLLGSIYDCGNFENCQKLLADNTYNKLDPLAFFIQYQDNSVSLIDDTVHQRIDFTNSNLIIHKRGYFKSSENGVYGFQFQDQNTFTTFQIDKYKQKNMGTDNSIFWIHLDANTVHNFSITSLINNQEAIKDDMNVIYPSGEEENLHLSAFYTELSNTKDSTAIRKIFKRNDSPNNGNANYKTVNATATYEVHYGSPDAVKRQWWDCDNNPFIYTCSGIPTTEVISGITAKMYYTTCNMPSYMLGHYGGALNYQTFSVGETTIVATLTDWTVGSFTCTNPTTLVDPTGSTVTAICTDQPSELLYGVNYVRDLVITSCDFPVGVSATFLETSTLSRIDWEFTTYITDTDIPTFSPVISTISITDPAGNLAAATCTFQLETFFEDDSTISVPTTTCEMPTNMKGEVLPSTSILTIPDLPETFTLTNLNGFRFSPVNVAISVTNPLGSTTTALCVASFTETIVFNSTFSFPVSSCSMPDDIDGEFSPTILTTIAKFNNNTSTIFITNTNVPLFATATVPLMVTDPTGKTGTATCEINNVQTTINNSPFVFHTTTCTMPTNIHGTFAENDQETVLSNNGNMYTITLLNENLPQYDIVETTFTLTDPTGVQQLATCEIDITLFETIGTTIGVPITTCLDPADELFEFQVSTSFTTLSFNDQYATLSVTNKVIPKFKQVLFTRNVTDPTGLVKEATCNVNYAYSNIVTTSCTMPTDIKGTFSPTISSTTLTASGTTSVITFTNFVNPFFDEINQMMFVIDLTGATCTATCAIGMTTLPVENTYFLLPTTSCEMPSSVDAKFIEKHYTSVITEDNVQTTLTVVNLNIATFSPITSLLTINDLADKTVTATCAVDFTSATIQDSTVSIPTTSCNMPSGIAASFFVMTRTTEVTIDNNVVTLTVTDLAVPTYFAVEESMNIVNPQGNLTQATCTVSFTKVSVNHNTVDLKTTSCSMPQDFGGEFVEKLSTTLVTLSDITITVTVTNINEASFAPAQITKTVIDPTGTIVEASCFAQFSKIFVSTSTFSLLTTSCAMPTDVKGTFEARIQSTDLVINDFTTAATITNIDSPYFSPVFTTISLTNSEGTTGDATCAIDFTSTIVMDATVSIPTTSCKLGTDLIGKFVTSIFTTVITEGNLTTTIEVTNTNQPSFLAKPAYVTPITNDDGDSIDATCEVGLTSFTVPGTTLAIPTTSCEFPEDVIGSYEYVYSTTIFSTGSFITTIVITNSILGTEWTRAYKTITSTTTIANDFCAFETTTITNPPVRGTVVEIIAVATPTANCPVTTRTVQNSVCSLVTITTATVASGYPHIVYEELVLTPANSCNIIYTTVEGTDCNSHRRTTNIVTYSNSSTVNATLIVVETPAGSACLSSSNIFSSINIASRTSSEHSPVASSAKVSSTSNSESGVGHTSTSSFESNAAGVLTDSTSNTLSHGSQRDTATTSPSNEISGNVKYTNTNNDTSKTFILTADSEVKSQTTTFNHGHTFTEKHTKTLTVTCTKTVCTHVPLREGDVTVTETGVDTVIVTVTCLTDSEGSVITIADGHTVIGTTSVEPTVTHSSMSRTQTQTLSTKEKSTSTITASKFEGSAPQLYKGSSTGILFLMSILAVLF